MAEGSLKITLIGAQGLGETQMMGKQDPYCLFNLMDMNGTVDSSRTVRSSVSVDGGKNPSWNEVLTLHISPVHQHKVRVDVWNKNEINTNAYIGYAEFPITGALNSVGTQQSLQVPMHKKSGKTKGTLNLYVQFEPWGGYSSAPPPVQATQVAQPQMAQPQAPWPAGSDYPPPYPGVQGYNSSYAYPPGGTVSHGQPVAAQPVVAQPAAAQSTPAQHQYPYNSGGWSSSAPPSQPPTGYNYQYPGQLQQQQPSAAPVEYNYQYPHQPPPAGYPQQPVPSGYPPQVHSAFSGSQNPTYSQYSTSSHKVKHKKSKHSSGGTFAALGAGAAAGYLAGSIFKGPKFF